MRSLTSVIISRFYFGLAQIMHEEVSAVPSQSFGPATTIRFGRESDLVSIARRYYWRTARKKTIRLTSPIRVIPSY